MFLFHVHEKADFFRLLEVRICLGRRIDVEQRDAAWLTSPLVYLIFSGIEAASEFE